MSKFYFWPLFIVIILTSENNNDRSTKPINKLQKAINKSVTVRLKSDVEYKGKMVHADPHMNLLLENAEEYVDNKLVENFGRVVIRGNNILFVVIDEEISVTWLMLSSSLYMNILMDSFIESSEISLVICEEHNEK